MLMVTGGGGGGGDLPPLPVPLSGQLSPSQSVKLPTKKSGGLITPGLCLSPHLTGEQFSTEFV